MVVEAEDRGLVFRGDDDIARGHREGVGPVLVLDEVKNSLTLLDEDDVEELIARVDREAEGDDIAFFGGFGEADDRDVVIDGVRGRITDRFGFGLLGGFRSGFRSGFGSGFTRLFGDAGRFLGRVDGGRGSPTFAAGS